jgi:hypothetical protein
MLFSCLSGEADRYPSGPFGEETLGAEITQFFPA